MSRQPPSRKRKAVALDDYGAQVDGASVSIHHDDL